QRGYQSLVRRRRGRAEQRPHPFGEPRPALAQRGHAMAPESRRVVIADVQRQPRHRLLAALRPVGQQDRLAVPRRGADQHQSARPRRGCPHTARGVPDAGGAGARAVGWPATPPARGPPSGGAGGAAHPCPTRPPLFPPVTAHDERDGDGTSVPSPSRKDSTWHVHFRVTLCTPSLRYLPLTDLPNVDDISAGGSSYL